MPYRPRLAALAAAVTLAAAAAGGACHSAPRAEGVPGEPALVIFANQSSYEAAVYAVPANGGQLRIGTVLPGRTDTLQVRGAALAAGGSVTIVARLRAIGRAPSTGQFLLQPGDRVVVTLPREANILGLLPAR